MTALADAPEDVQDGPTVRLRDSDTADVTPQAIGTIYKVAIGMYTDTGLAKDVMQVTPHFHDKTGAQTPGALATQIANGIGAFFTGPVQGYVKVYLEDFSPQNPHNPLAHVDLGTAGTYLSSSGPREIALCVSYYAGQNTKRYRGRLYLPHAWIRVAGGGASAAPGPRPTAQMMATALSFGTSVLKPPALNGNQWCVASTVDKIARDATTYWVDDEWDIIRSRGFRGSTRQTATLP